MPVGHGGRRLPPEDRVPGEPVTQWLGRALLPRDKSD